MNRRRDPHANSNSSAGKDIFNHGRHRWLSRVARDDELAGGTLRVAICLWDMFNVERGSAWPSIAYMTEALGINRSTVIRAVNSLEDRGWITRVRGRRGRSTIYRLAFGNFHLDDDEPD